METTLFPTKGNLIIAKNTLRLSRQGYELLDKKRNILIREMMELIDIARNIQEKIDETFREAYVALQRVNIVVGIEEVRDIAHAIPAEESINVRFRSIMGVEIPQVQSKPASYTPKYGFFRTPSSLDEAMIKFLKVKELTVELAQIENSVYRLAKNIKKTQKRANALKNSTIPKYEELTKNIQSYLEEKEREEFTRLKVIKRWKT